ncbi:MAG: DUF3267 domain-containing protein, partial [Oscillospiraceae bacterium]|nr:DUF3267 domain-containing protein [Oscillospiraceae bacterium]
MKVSEEEKNRKLSPAEQKRMDRLDKITEELENKGYTRNDRTIDIVKANVVTILLSLPVMAVTVGLFFLVNRSGPADSFGKSSFWIFTVSYIVLIVVHELIHGLTWSIFAPNRWKDIE